MCSLPIQSTNTPDDPYGYEVLLMGIGFALGLTTVLAFVRIVDCEANLCKSFAHQLS